MIDSSGLNVTRLLHGSRFPFHSSARVAVRRSVRQITWRITRCLGGSSQTTVSARPQTMSRTAP